MSGLVSLGRSNHLDQAGDRQECRGRSPSLDQVSAKLGPGPRGSLEPPQHGVGPPHPARPGHISPVPALPSWGPGSGTDPFRPAHRCHRVPFHGEVAEPGHLGERGSGWCERTRCPPGLRGPPHPFIPVCPRSFAPGHLRSVPKGVETESRGSGGCTLGGTHTSMETTVCTEPGPGDGAGGARGTRAPCGRHRPQAARSTGAALSEAASRASFGTRLRFIPEDGPPQAHQRPA